MLNIILLFWSLSLSAGAADIIQEKANAFFDSSSKKKTITYKKVCAKAYVCISIPEPLFVCLKSRAKHIECVGPGKSNNPLVKVTVSDIAKGQDIDELLKLVAVRQRDEFMNNVAHIHAKEVLKAEPISIDNLRGIRQQFNFDFVGNNVSRTFVEDINFVKGDKRIHIKFQWLANQSQYFDTLPIMEKSIKIMPLVRAVKEPARLSDS